MQLNHSLSIWRSGLWVFEEVNELHILVVAVCWLENSVRMGLLASVLYRSTLNEGILAYIWSVLKAVYINISHDSTGWFDTIEQFFCFNGFIWNVAMWKCNWLNMLINSSIRLAARVELILLCLCYLELVQSTFSTWLVDKDNSYDSCCFPFFLTQQWKLRLKHEEHLIYYYKQGKRISFQAGVLPLTRICCLLLSINVWFFHSGIACILSWTNIPSILYFKVFPISK